MDSQLNEKLIHAIREQLPEGNSLVTALMDILSLGKEAAYRRLRGDVVFSFEDVAKISRKLGISLDKVIGESKVLDNNKWAFIDISALTSSYSSDYMQQYSKRMEMFLDVLRSAQEQSPATVRCATCHIPYYFTIPHRKLTLFRHYKRAYLTNGINPGFRFSDMEMSTELYQAEKQLLKYLESSKNLLILDRRVFSSIVSDIYYFYLRKLISEKELLQLKEELLEILACMEDMTATGMLNPETEVSVYLSDINLDASYVHIESSSFEYAHQWTYFVDAFSFYNPTVCQMQKNWIELLKRYSTLITQTGEMQRVDFFNIQKGIINTLVY